MKLLVFEMMVSLHRIHLPAVELMIWIKHYKYFEVTNVF
ncbi:unnamed protein product [Trichobilharzia regenti]|nr:unnamed protein product [Trichobilharzia regenti]